MSGKRPEFVAWDAGVQDGLHMSRVEAFGALRRAAAEARLWERLADQEEGATPYALGAQSCANAIRGAIRRAIDSETIR